MIKYNLNCKKCTYSFDSWFLSSLEFDRIEKKKLIKCIKCDSNNVSKSIMSPNLNAVKEFKKDKSKDKSNKKILKKIAEYQKFIKKNCNYVGEDFAYQARSIHYSKDVSKSIYGKATAKEISELSEEGIETENIPWIEDKKN